MYNQPGKTLSLLDKLSDFRFPFFPSILKNVENKVKKVLPLLEIHVYCDIISYCKKNYEYQTYCISVFIILLSPENDKNTNQNTVILFF